MSRFLALSLVFLLAPLSSAQEDKIRWVKLSVEPQAAPVPALKYHLLPEVRDLKPGNAALLYQRAHSPEWISVLRNHPDYATFYDWIYWPLEKFPVTKARSIKFHYLLREVDLAARREFCDWEMIERIRQDNFSLFIPDVQGFRIYSSLLALRAHLEMLEKRYDKAVYTLQTGFALSRHLSEQPILISSLVSVAIAVIMANEVDLLVQQPGAPNLYWALTDLPRPFIDMRRAYQGERLAVEGMCFEVQQALDDPQLPALSPEQLTAVSQRLGTVMPGPGSAKGLEGRFMGALAAALMHKEAKEYLAKQGYAAARLEALPTMQVVLMYQLAEYNQILDDFRKWVNLPYGEAWAGLREADKKVRQKTGILPTGSQTIARLLLPALARVFLAQIRVDRRLAALRTVEALRLHAAAHEGQLPESLSDIRAVPVPLDPLTGRPFDYRMEGNQAWVSGAAPAGEQAQEGNTIRYHITIKGSKK